MRERFSRLSAGLLAPPDVPEQGHEQARERSRTLAGHTAGWIVLVAFMYRALVAPTALIGSYSNLGPRIDSYISITIALSLLNLSLVGYTITRRAHRFLITRTFVVTDLTIAFGVNIWAALLLPTGTYLLTYRDVFSLYIAGTAALMTILKGWRTGVLISITFVCLQFACAHFTASPLTIGGLLQIGARAGWVVNGVMVPLVIMKLAQHGVQLADTEAIRAGRLAERAQTLRAMHDTVLQVFGQIVRRSTVKDVSDDDRLHEAHELAATQRKALHEALDNDSENTQTTLRNELRQLVKEFAGTGFRIELVDSGISVDPPALITEALVGAAREALANTRRHAGVEHAIVRAASSKESIEITIRDHGKGFDPTAPPAGFGLQHSIIDRLKEIEGTAEIWSAIGQGSRVHLCVHSNERQGRRRTRDQSRGWSSTADRTVTTLTTQAVNWFAIAALAYRIALSPLQLASTIANSDLNAADSTRMFTAFGFVLATDAIVIIGLLMARLEWLLRSVLVCAIDIAVAAGLNIWSAVVLPAGTVTTAGNEIFWGYTMGVVVLWTGLRGLRLGLIIAVGGLPLQAALLWLNGTSMAEASWTQVAVREGYLVLALAVAWMLTALARKGANVAVVEGLRAGRALERVQALRALYRNVISALTQIEERSSASRQPSAMRLREIRGIALAQTSALRAALDAEHSSKHNYLAHSLSTVANKFRSLGLRVELVLSEVDLDPPGSVTDAVIGAVREALTNTWQHAGVEHAVVRAVSSEDWVEITIRDQGCGFDPAAPSSGRGIPWIEDRMQNIGGTAEIRSTLERGTRVRLALNYGRTVTGE